jgi:aspartyl-tRNA(Asn)/glutamyl-tRNA(Gln) amidotransferase subunit C
MKITAQEVAHVAALARLKLSGEMTEKLTSQLSDILEAMDKLNELDTTGVPPTHHAMDLTGAMRPDQVTDGIDHDQALANAPDSDGQSLVVPRVI